MDMDFDTILEQDTVTTEGSVSPVDDGEDVEEVSSETQQVSSNQPITNNQQQVKQPVRISRFTRLNIRHLLSKDDDGKYDSATLGWSIRGEYPRITVITSNNKAYVNKKMNFDHVITAPFDIIGLEIFLSKFEEVINSNSSLKYKIDCLNLKFKDGVRTQELYTQATVICGKDDEGIIYLAALEDMKPKIKFKLLPNRFFKYYNVDGTEIKDQAILSKMYAKAYLKVLRDYLYTDVIGIDKTVVNV